MVKFGLVKFGLVKFGLVWFGLVWDNIHPKLQWKFHPNPTCFDWFREDLKLGVGWAKQWFNEFKRSYNTLDNHSSIFHFWIWMCSIYFQMMDFCKHKLVGMCCFWISLTKLHKLYCRMSQPERKNIKKVQSLRNELFFSTYHSWAIF